MFPFFAVVGAVLGYRALVTVPLDAPRLKAALWLVAVPWILSMMLILPMASLFELRHLFRDIEGSDHVIWSSPITAAALAACWWMRRCGKWRPDPSPEYQALMAARAERDSDKASER